MQTSHLHTYGGLDWVSDDPTQQTAHGSGPTTLHNQVSAARATVVGLRAEWAASSALGLHGGLHTTVWGENVDDAFFATVGVSWAFQIFGRAAP